MKGKAPDVAEVIVSRALVLQEGAVFDARTYSWLSNSCWAFSKWHSRQRICRLLSSLEPPAASGLMWSMWVCLMATSFAPKVERLALGLGEGDALDLRGAEGAADLAHKVADGLALELELVGLAKLEDALVAEVRVYRAVHVDAGDDARRLLL